MSLSSKQVVPEDGMIITEDVTLVPGVYVLRHGLTIAADGVTLDGAGAMLVGSQDWPVAIFMEGRRDVTIKNLSTVGFHHAVRLKNCRDVNIVGNRFRFSSELDFYSHPLSVYAPLEQMHGAAIFLQDVQSTIISDNDMGHQQNGVLAYGCRGLIIERNQAPMCSGQGVYLYDSHECTIQDNLLDFCARISHLPDGRKDIGAGAASVMLISGSSKNLILRNFMRGSGDGVLACGYPEAAKVAQCNDNIIEGNDASYCLNVSFEATFGRRNVFRENKANGSNYGFWLGYSCETEVVDNEIIENRIAGVAIEHGHGNSILGNILKRNRSGILLWTDYYEQLVRVFPDCEASWDYTIARNVIEANRDGIRSYTEQRVREPLCYNYRILDNTIRDNHTGIRLQRVRDCELQGNRLVNNHSSGVWLIKCSDISAVGNVFEANRVDVIGELTERVDDTSHLESRAEVE
ncbi:MAG TPA: NosD domain-containing protein [Armatimonadota bacterium]|nr:NosD domain-containing protein [Armatimonadota bacterium]